MLSRPDRPETVAPDCDPNRARSRPRPRGQGRRSRGRRDVAPVLVAHERPRAEPRGARPVDQRAADEEGAAGSGAPTRKGELRLGRADEHREGRFPPAGLAGPRRSGGQSRAKRQSRVMVAREASSIFAASVSESPTRIGARRASQPAGGPASGLPAPRGRRRPALGPPRRAVASPIRRPRRRGSRPADRAPLRGCPASRGVDEDLSHGPCRRGDSLRRTSDPSRRSAGCPDALR